QAEQEQRGHQRDADAGHVHGGAGIDPAQLEAPEARVTLESVYRVVELVLDHVQNPALGLHWAERLGEGTFVPLSHLLVHAASLRQAMACLAQFGRLLADVPGYRLLEQDDEFTLEAVLIPGQSLRFRRLQAELTVGGFFRLIRYFDPRARARLCFAHAAPDYHAEYTRVFGQAVEFDQPFTGLTLDRAVLDAAAPHKDADVHAVLQTVAERRLSRLTHRLPYAVRLREYLVREGWRQHSDMEQAARALGLSVRSLRRKLAAEQASYSEIADEALATVAKEFLHDPRRTIQETAYELGFSDASTFHRAFKRWTGTTPSAYREEQLVTRGAGSVLRPANAAAPAERLDPIEAANPD
ncbi:MAG TPA: AraC family transcriptional regulator, partial [Polyangiales bacterium]